jgi:hypothetical protein
MPTPLKILITSQKGGVGKSTVSANLAAYFALIAEKKTALVDLDHQATAGKWIRNAAPMGVQCVSVESPNNKGVGMALLQAKQALRSVQPATQTLIADLTWTDILPPEFLFDFDLVLVPTSLSRVEMDSTLEFVNRFSFVFNSTLRNPPKLVIVPSRVANLETYANIFYQSFKASFFLSPPVMLNENAGEFFGANFFVKAEREDVRENFIDFGNAIASLGAQQVAEAAKPKMLYTTKLSGSILERFRAGRNEKTSTRPTHAANDLLPDGLQRKIKEALPSFLRIGSFK